MRKLRKIVAYALSASLWSQQRFDMTAWSFQRGSRPKLHRTACRAADSDVITENPFAILGISAREDGKGIRKAFRKLAATLHPDVPGTGDAAEFRKVLWAYKTLAAVPDAERGVGKDSEYMKWGLGVFSKLQNMEEIDLYGVYEEILEGLPEEADYAVNLSQALDEGTELNFLFDEPVSETRMLELVREEKPRALPEARTAAVEGTFNTMGSREDRPYYQKIGARLFVYFRNVSWASAASGRSVGWWIGPILGDAVGLATHWDVEAQVPPSMGWKFLAGADQVQDTDLHVSAFDNGSLAMTVVAQEGLSPTKKKRRRRRT